MSYPDPYLSSRSAAEYLDVADYTLRRSRLAGGLLLGFKPPPSIKVGHSVRYRMSELNKWLERNKKEVHQD